MRKSQALLYRFMHDPAYVFADVRICYVNRGAPGDMTCVTGDSVLRLGAGFMEIESVQGIVEIPYHRLISIEYRGAVVWKVGEGNR